MPEKISKEAVLQFVKYNGPCLPNDARKKLASDTFFIGAFLSELIGDRKVFVSSLRVGGSPLYYCQGQEAKLQNFVQYLNEKDRQAYDLLKDRRVLRDTALTPLLRVSLRTIKDFAKPLEAQGTKELFWRWYLTPVELAAEEVKKIHRVADTKKETKAAEPAQPARMPAVEQKIEQKKGEQKKEVLERPPEIKPVQKTLAELKAMQEQSPKKLETKPEKKEEKLKEQEKPAEAKREKPKKEGKDLTSSFLTEIAAYFSENKIEVIETVVIKKASEADYVVAVPSAVGKLTYYCKAKGKKTVNDGDLSSAYVTGESKKLPVLYVTTGKLTKRAKEMLGKEFKTMTVKEFP